MAFPGQWQLSHHKIANQLIYESLVRGDWDGEDLFDYLQQLDQQNAGTMFHVFCRSDKRFSLSSNEEGHYRISLSQPIARVSLKAEQKQALELLADQLFAAFPQQRRSPWTTFEILEQILRLSSDSSSLKNLYPTELAHWLSQRNEWAKVGRDLWFPKPLLPPSVQHHRYAVLAVNTKKGNRTSPSLESVEISEQIMSEAVKPEISHNKELQSPQQTISSSRWKVTLRTLHLNEGYIPIPPQPRVLYPRDRKLQNVFTFAGIWFADASEITVWLDTIHHLLYGPDLTDQLAFLEAGTILEISWNNAGFTFSLVGQDSATFEEEARLIDLTELAQVRSTLLESYRSSLRILLALSPQGETFPDLYLALCQRQQHRPNRSTIRVILSSSPEFSFNRQEKRWKLLSNISEEAGASTLRKIAVAVQQITNKSSHQSGDTLSLAAMIARNRQQLTDLRQFYKDRNQISSS